MKEAARLGPATSAFDKGYARFVKAVRGITEEAELDGIVPQFDDSPEEAEQEEADEADLVSASEPAEGEQPAGA